jgi:hypothetical protein
MSKEKDVGHQDREVILFEGLCGFLKVAVKFISSE